MDEPEITWVDVGSEHNVPHAIVRKEIVTYPIETEVIERGKKVTKRTMFSFTVCTAKRIKK